jgi:hypothetical protein
MTELTITWCTNYNGVWVGPEDLNDDDYDIVEKANDEMGLPGLTYDMCSEFGCFDEPELSDEQIETLKEVVRNNEDLKKLYGEFEVSFVEDWSST